MHKFVTGVVLRFALLLVLLTALAFTLGNWNFMFTQLIILAVFVLLLVEFFRYITRTNRDLARFISALRYGDFSIGFGKHGLAGGFDELHSSFREIFDQYRDNRLEKEEQFQLIQTLVDRMPVGLMACDAREEIVILNRTASELIGAQGMKNLERLERVVPGLPDKLRVLPLEVFTSMTLGQHKQHEAVVQRSRIKGRFDLDVFVFQNLADTYDNREMDAWLKLIRILTHEIMNSVTSVSSLSSTALHLSYELPSAELTEALLSIHKRSTGMLGFVDDYRRLTSVPAPRKQWFSLLELAKEQTTILKAEMDKYNIIPEFRGSEKLQVNADPAQVAQVVINVLLNAFHAMEKTGTPELVITVEKTGSLTTLSIEDNGKGITPEEMNQVFIPFYSTREGGSGIGLSLCRQIMRNHGGSISLRSQAGKGSIFTLTFTEV